MYCYCICYFKHLSNKFTMLNILSFLIFLTLILSLKSFNRIFNHWTCVGYDNFAGVEQDNVKPYVFNVGELPLVAWKNKGHYFSTINICKHMGSKLGNAKITEKGCLKCAYHGFEYSPVPTDCFGKMTSFEGKLFWSYDPILSSPSETPFYNNENYEKSEIFFDMECSLPDSAYNSMDLRHPEFVHNNLFGFGTSIPATNIIHKFNSDSIELEFDYFSRSSELKSELFTKNKHFFTYPSSTWSIVNFLKSKNLVVGVHFQPLKENKTRWYVTFLHNYKRSHIGKELIKIMGKAILFQDSLQMKNQSPENKLKDLLFLNSTFGDEDTIIEMRNYFKNYRYPNMEESEKLLRHHLNSDNLHII